MSSRNVPAVKEEVSGVVSHLQCPLCGQFCSNNAQKLSHLAANHPYSLESVAVGRLGNILMYQKDARLFHCAHCFFTSKDFSKLFRHIIGKHCTNSEERGEEEGEEGEEEEEEGKRKKKMKTGEVKEEEEEGKKSGKFGQEKEGSKRSSEEEEEEEEGEKRKKKIRTDEVKEEEEEEEGKKTGKLGQEKEGLKRSSEEEEEEGRKRKRSSEAAEEKGVDIEEEGKKRRRMEEEDEVEKSNTSDGAKEEERRKASMKSGGTVEEEGKRQQSGEEDEAGKKSCEEEEEGGKRKGSGEEEEGPEEVKAGDGGGGGEVRGGGEGWRCTICGYSSKPKAPVINHVVKKHQIPRECTLPLVRSTDCPPAEEEEKEMGLSEEMLKEEMEATAKVMSYVSYRFVCLFCGWKSRIKGLTSSHVGRCHDVECPYKCKYCGRSFFLPSRLQQHILLMHRPGRYVCPFCYFRSPMLGGFRRHCSVCNARPGEEEERDGEERGRGGEEEESEEEQGRKEVRAERKRKAEKVEEED